MNQIFVACSHIYLVVAMIPLIYVLVFGTMFFSRRFVFGLFLVHVFLIVKHRSIDYVRKMVKAYQGDNIQTLKPMDKPHFQNSAKLPFKVQQKKPPAQPTEQQLPKKAIKVPERAVFSMRDLSILRQQPGKFTHHQSLVLKKSQDPKTLLQQPQPRPYSPRPPHSPSSFNKHTSFRERQPSSSLFTPMKPTTFDRPSSPAASRRSSMTLEIQTRDLKRLALEFEQSMKKLGMGKAVYGKSVNWMKENMRKDIGRLIRVHTENLAKLDRFISSNFNYRMKESSPQDYKGPTVDLEDIAAQNKCGKATGAILWDFAQTKTPEERAQAMKQLTALCAQRQMVERCMLIRKPDGRPYDRLLLFKRLKLVMDKLSGIQHSRYQHLDLPQLPNCQLQFQVFSGFVNRYLQARGLPFLPQPRIYPTLIPEDRDNPVFFLHLLASGLTHYNIGCSQQFYSCQPGPDNVYSVMAMYVYLLQTKKKDNAMYKGLGYYSEVDKVL